MGGIAAGMVLGERFEVVRRLGAGGLAEVFEAKDRVSSQDVALKALHDHLASDGALSERFRREMALTRSLDHPGIVRVFDLHQHEGRPFFSMELLRGRPLSAALREGPLTAPEARRITAAICSALREAHRAGIVHRDLKPQNVFLGDDGTVKVLDFGLARVAGQARLTAQSMVMGTPGYIAPELLSGTQADARADVYSLGATFFEMLTGRHAFSGADPFAVLKQQREGPPSMPGVDPADAAVIRRMLEPDPERRFLDVEQVLRALGGQLVPLAPEPVPALSGGHFDVLAIHHGFGEGKRVRAIAARLGGRRPALGWRARLTFDGKNRLVAGASDDTAQAVAELCRSEGIAAMVVPAKSRWKATEFLARHCGKIGAALASVVPLWVLNFKMDGVRLWYHILFMSGPKLGQELRESFMILGVLFLAVYVPVAGLLMMGAEPPLKDLPAGNPALARLTHGISRRIARLREKCAGLPPPQRMLLDDLLREVAATETVAAALTAQVPADEPEAQTLPQGTSRDRVAARLLEIAAALDDALAAVEQPATEGASEAMRRLREEIQFARKVLPDEP